MYLKIVCLNELNRNHFYLLPLRLLLLPLNKNCFSNIVGFCVYITNTIIHGCLEIWNFSSRVQFDISRVSVSRWTLEEKSHISARPCIIVYIFLTQRARSMHDVVWHCDVNYVCSKDAHKQWARTSLRRLETVLLGARRLGSNFPVRLKIKTNKQKWRRAFV